MLAMFIGAILFFVSNNALADDGPSRTETIEYIKSTWRQISDPKPDNSYYTTMDVYTRNEKCYVKRFDKFKKSSVTRWFLIDLSQADIYYDDMGLTFRCMNKDNCAQYKHSKHQQESTDYFVIGTASNAYKRDKILKAFYHLQVLCTGKKDLF